MSRREDNIRMDLEEIGISEGNLADWAQDRNYWRALVNAALNLRVPQAMELVNVCYKSDSRDIYMDYIFILRRYPFHLNYPL